MKILSALALVLLLGACGLTPQGEIIRASAIAKARDVADTSIENAVWFMCEGSSAGSVLRRFGSTDETWEAWKKICLTSSEIKRPGAE